MIFIRTEALVRSARNLLANENASVDQIYRLKLEVEQLKDDYEKWPDSLRQEWKPNAVGDILTSGNEKV